MWQSSLFPLPLDGLLGNSSVSLSTSLHVIRIHARRGTSGVLSLPRLLAAVVVDVLNVEGVDVSGDVTEKRQAYVDEQI